LLPAYLFGHNLRANKFLLTLGCFSEQSVFVFYRVRLAAIS
jgi:hypothetical protein